jgi:opacity protein-like surface antigen
MKKIALTIGAILALASAAYAAEVVAKPEGGTKSENANTIGVQSSQVTGNGAAVSEQAKSGTRGETVSSQASGGKAGGMKEEKTK